MASHDCRNICGQCLSNRTVRERERLGATIGRMMRATLGCFKRLVSTRPIGCGHQVGGGARRVARAAHRQSPLPLLTDTLPDLLNCPLSCVNGLLHLVAVVAAVDAVAVATVLERISISSLPLWHVFFLRCWRRLFIGASSLSSHLIGPYQGDRSFFLSFHRRWPSVAAAAALAAALLSAPICKSRQGRIKN